MIIINGFKSTLVGACAAICISSAVYPRLAQAALVDHGSYTQDTTTGLAWLDVTATINISFLDLQNGAGGWVNQGWRYATGPELSDLFTRYIGTGPEDYAYQASAYQNALTLVREFGVIFSFNNSEGNRQVFGPSLPVQISLDGRFNDGNPNGLVGIAELTAKTKDYPDSAQLNEGARWVVYNDFFNDQNLPSGYGNFLVREGIAQAVPEPSTWAMLLLGFAGLGFMAYRRNEPALMAARSDHRD
jgi:hypothetical protein